jgi:hypothetical protein
MPVSCHGVLSHASLPSPVIRLERLMEEIPFSPRRRARRRGWWLAAAAVPPLWLTAALGLAWFWPDAPHAVFKGGGMDYPGVNRPPAVPAARADVADDAPVIGVVAGGRARAYVVQALARSPLSHIVNDVLGGVPVSVTHCPIAGCTRVFAGEGDAPLDLRQGGLTADGMTVRAAGREYYQETQAPVESGPAAFPYSTHPWVTTTWGAWRRAHPDADVYVGPPGGVYVGG